MRKGKGPGRVIEPEVTNTMISMLESTIRYGTGKKANINRPAAGKTGTSQSLRDAWFVGFTSDIVAGVWFGNDDDSPMKEITGGTAPANLWKNFMIEAHGNAPSRSLQKTFIASDTKKSQRSKIDEIIKKSREFEKKRNVFEKILENFF